MTSLENNPVFNAGFGSVLTEEGTVETDAFIMDGNTLKVGKFYDNTLQSLYNKLWI